MNGMLDKMDTFLVDAVLFIVSIGL